MMDEHETHAEAPQSGNHAIATAESINGINLKQLDACIHCGYCLPVCPTYQVTGSEAESPRGRLYLMRQWIEGTLDNAQQLSNHLESCLGCLACQTACPSGVQYEQLLLQSRASLLTHKTKPSNPLKRLWKRFLLKQVLPNPQLLATLVRWLQYYQVSGLQKTVRQSGILKFFPSLAWQEQLTPNLMEDPPGKLLPGMTFGNPDCTPVALFTGCIMDAAYRRIHWATVRVLVANGYRVTIAHQSCCGALAYHGGEMDIAHELAQTNMNQWRRFHNQDQHLVINSAGCGAALKEYPHIAPESPLARGFSSQVIDIMALLAQKPLAPFKYSVPRKVAYHAACHLHHAQKVQQEPVEILGQLPGIKLIPLKNADTCCGSAGVYNISQPELSQAILANKMKSIEESGADLVVTGNPGCLLQLEAGGRMAQLNLPVMHPIELLAQAYYGSDQIK